MPKERSGRLRTLALAAQNALDLVRFGRLSTTPYGARFSITHETDTYRLRHYEQTRDGAPPILLVPPLMVTAEVYDIAPDVSAVATLVNHGIDVWLVDFGAPEREQGGMSRTLDDHVRAVSDAVDRVRTATGRSVHLAGYSQGGMFAYQVAALRKSRDLASIITFGSPVDIYRNIPKLNDALAQRLLGFVRTVIARPLEEIDGLPGTVTSTGFKVLSARKEIRQLIDFVRKLHDRQALERRESRRLFLGGQGFVAWPGPALRTFVDEIIVHNRMLTGGFAVDGHLVTLADIRCPILYFAGLRDDMARPPAVRGIRKAAPYAECFEIDVKAGHFGLVVGSTAQSITWPAVIDWLYWREGRGPRPEALERTEAEEHRETTPERSAGDTDEATMDETLAGLRSDAELLWDVVASGAQTLWNRLGLAARDLGGDMRSLRVQMSHLNRLRSITGETRISAGLALAENAASMGEKTFFLWHGRAFSYGDSNRRVDNVVRGLLACGITPGQRIGMMMASRPSFLSTLVALNRLGAVAVLMSPNTSAEALGRAAKATGMTGIITDPEHVSGCRAGFAGPVLMLGSGKRRAPEADEGDSSADEVIDMETIDPTAVALPEWYAPDAGQARDLAMIIVSTGKNGAVRAAHVTNHRWAFSALGAASTATLTDADTVFCCLPLHHAAGSLVAAGSALVSGARLALVTPPARGELDAAWFWSEVRRHGATVVFYAGDMCRALVHAPPHPADRSHPVRLFAGSGMRKDVWQALVKRFGAPVLEFYASTEGNAVLANVSGQKPGALGSPIPASTEVAVAACNLATGELVTDAQGRLVACATDEPGLLVARLDETHPRRHVTHGHRALGIVRDGFAAGDAWFVTGDVVRRDAGGDFWLVDRLGDMVRTPTQVVATREVEDALHLWDEVKLAVAYGVALPQGAGQALAVAVVTRSGKPLAAEALTMFVADTLEPAMRPLFVRFVSDVPMNDGYRPQKSVLGQAGVHAEDKNTLCYDADTERYAVMDQEGYARAVAVAGG